MNKTTFTSITRGRVVLSLHLTKLGLMQSAVRAFTSE